MQELIKIAVMTSGGDAPGMNASVRGVVRAGLNRGWEVFGVRDAYRGLAEGGEGISLLDWVDAGWNFREGGTFLGSSRFPEVMGNSSRAESLKERMLLNLKHLGISGLVVIGGDGSLTGACELHRFLTARTETDRRFEPLQLSVVGIPGSIDNDIADTDMSIGVDTTLNTIVECIDKLRDTASSHKRISVVEVMGRLRGYLAVMSGLATGADRIFIREETVDRRELNKLIRVLQRSFLSGQKSGIIVRSEGAEVSTNFLKETVAVLLKPKRDVRETVLGHLQRGGNPSCFERALATRMGVKAVEIIAERPGGPRMVGITENEMRSVPLEALLQKLKSPAFKAELSANARGAFALSRKLEEPPAKKSGGRRIAVLTDGNNVSGMNMAIRSVARIAINEGMDIIGIKGGFAGLLQGAESALNLEWPMLEMKSVLRRAGTLLGVSGNGIAFDGKDYLTIRKQVKDLQIDGLIAIGGNATYQCAHRLSRSAQIPVVGIPADTNCNLPGTNWVIGMDSALNDIQKGIDRSSDAAQVQKKIYIVHLKGKYCRCLVHLAALSGGAEQLIFDDSNAARAGEALFERLIRRRIMELKKIIDLGKRFATVVFFSPEADGEGAAHAISQAVADAGIRMETSIVPLEASYGGIVPTSFDRVLAMRLGELAMTSLRPKLEGGEGSFDIVGISGKGLVVNPYRAHIDGIDLGCPPAFVAELQKCFDLMAVPDQKCAGLGGDVQWIDVGDQKRWRGLWRCKQCGRSQSFFHNPGKSESLGCKNPECGNYGYIRISRRL